MMKVNEMYLCAGVLHILSVANFEVSRLYEKRKLNVLPCSQCLINSQVFA